MKDKKYNKGGMVRGGNASKREAQDYEDFGKKGKTSAPRKSPVPKPNPKRKSK